MASDQRQARHVFHPATTGWDRVHAWREATGEPAFVWGGQSGSEDGAWFRSVKQAFKKWILETPDVDLTIYHDGVGADVLGPLDEGAQKVLFLHHWVPRWESYFDWTIRCTGKVLIGQPEFVGTIRSRFGWVPERYIQPIAQPPLQSTVKGKGGTGSKARTGIWLHGRPWRLYGNRLRAIVDRWPAEVGQLEIIASGSGRPSWAGKPHITWSADMPLEFALLRLHTWDSTLLLNDYSLDAPWLMAALALGCFPLIPEGEGITRAGLWDADSAPSPYPWGDTTAALKTLADWRRDRAQLWPAFDGWRQALLANVPTADQFPAAWQAVKQEFLSQRPPKLRVRKAVAGWQPVAWYERVQRLRMGV